MARKRGSRRRRASSNGNGWYLETDAYRYAWYAVALARAEELMRDPKFKKLIDDAIHVLQERIEEDAKR